MNNKFSRLIGCLLVCIGLASCSEPPVPDQDSPFRLTTDIGQSMVWILEPAADVIWDSAGFIIDADGETDLSPVTEEQWNAVIYAAATLSESGNLLMLPGRAAGADWIEYSQGLVTASNLALEAARAKDADALFDAGGRIYQVCRACHNQYWPEARRD